MVAKALILASRSPQRRAILEQLGVRFDVRPANVHEDAEGVPADVALANALRKARAVSAGAEGELVLGVDTIVTIDGRIHGKAADEAGAREHLRLLSGREHEVWSGLALVGRSGEHCGTERTTVRFRELGEQEIEWYLASGEWRERAGSYAIQGRGAALVAGIEGDYWNVVGLPVTLLLALAPEVLW